MDSIEILGGYPLYGEIRVQGSKNSALPIIAASILHKGVCVLHNCPRIIDVMYMVQILRAIGCDVHWETDALVIRADQVTSSSIPAEYAEKMRSSIVMLGSLLGRVKEASIPHPGGCVIGERPIDLHVSGLRKMGAVIEDDREELLYARVDQLIGCPVTLDFPSVGATENLILAGVLAEGETIIRNAAREPEIFELCQFLTAMGAKIRGAGTDVIVVQGVHSLHDVEYTVIPDRIVAGTYLCAAAATRGSIRISNTPAGQMEALMAIFGQMGIRCGESRGELWMDAKEGSRAVSLVETKPYPGFPTDLQSQLMAVLTLARGTSRIRETIFEARFKAAEGLRNMGASIETKGREAFIRGVESLKGTTVCAEELRGGAAYVIAGLAAEGYTTIQNRHFIDRGYEDICRDLQGMGANIKNRD